MAATLILIVAFQLQNIKMKLKQFITENKQKIGLALLGLAAAGALTYFLTRKPKGKQTTPVPIAVNQSTSTATSVEQAVKPQQPIIDNYDQKFAKVINEVRGLLDISGNQLTPQVITAIIRGQYALSNQDMKAITYKSRKERRAKLQDALQYARILTKHQLDQEELQEKHLGAILARFNIDRASWKQANNEWMDKTAAEPQGTVEGLSDLIRDLEEKQLLSYRIQNVKPKVYLIIQKILNFKIKTLEVLNPHELGVDLGADDAAKYDIIQTYINDLVFQKYNIEPEDVEFSIQQLSKQEKQKVVEKESRIAQLMEGFIGDDDQKESDFY